MPDWALLPDELINLIGDLLLSSNLLDFLRLRIVCKSWKSATKRPQKFSHLPWLMLSTTNEHTTSRSFFRLSDGNTHELSILFPRGNADEFYWHVKKKPFIANSWNGWLLIMDKLFLDLHLINPLNSTILHLPPLPEPERNKNDCSSYISFDDDTPSFYLSEIRKQMQSKVIVTTDRTSIAIFPWQNSLALARPGDKQWLLTETQFNLPNDIVEHQGVIYVIDKDGLISRFDAAKPDIITAITTRVPENEIAYRWYLVETPKKDLLIVARYTWMSSSRQFSSLSISITLDNLKWMPCWVL